MTDNIKNQLLVCRRVTKQYWQLPVPPTETQLSILACLTADAVEDAGMTPKSINLLSRSLTDCAAVCFASTDTSSFNQTQDKIIDLGSGGLMDKTEALLKNYPAKIELVITQSSKSAAKAFSGTVYNWWSQSAFVLLLEKESTPENIQRDTIMAIINNEWFDYIETLKSQSVVALIKPGVDGDIAGLYSFSSEIEDLILENLHTNANQQHWDYHELDEDEFANRLADKSNRLDNKEYNSLIPPSKPSRAT